MRIRMEQTGGIMGRKVNVELDTATLPAEEAETLRLAVDETNFFALPENLVTQTLPDEMQYLITVETNNLTHSVRTSDTTATNALRELIRSMAQHARAVRTKKE